MIVQGSARGFRMARVQARISARNDPCPGIIQQLPIPENLGGTARARASGAARVPGVVEDITLQETWNSWTERLVSNLNRGSSGTYTNSSPGCTHDTLRASSVSMILCDSKALNRRPSSKTHHSSRKQPSPAITKYQQLPPQEDRRTLQ